MFQLRFIYSFHIKNVSFIFRVKKLLTNANLFNNSLTKH
jgi:hypothetical protein